ncbi:dual specificity protein phosphatase 3-like [Tachypleus tridentatus]|uniref:dual specificity protein phosphatase 3-like n=1 Tax=Tachypleus tridentatus TaxID=6853 RepID=UPI003FD3794C
MATYLCPTNQKQNGETTTVTRLHHVILHTQPRSKLSGYTLFPRLLGRQMVSEDQTRMAADADEVYPGIFIGDERAARNKTYLKQFGITHVVNTAEGSGFGQVNTGRSYYHGTNIQYLGMNVLDIPQACISDHFEEAVNFIDCALKNGGKVLVHCLMGVSRSSTITIAYLMMRKGMTAEESLRTVRNIRDVRPNVGFLHQLVELETKLKSDK